MRPIRYAAEVTAVITLCVSAGAGRGHEVSNPEPAAQATPSARPADAAGTVPDAFEGMVFKLRLGEGPAQTIVIRRGTKVRLIMHAPTGTKLHLHGYDLGGTAADGAPVIITFDAEHTGRFQIEAHGVEDLLGRREKALAYVEIRSE